MKHRNKFFVFAGILTVLILAGSAFTPMVPVLQGEGPDCALPENAALPECQSPVDAVVETATETVDAVGEETDTAVNLIPERIAVGLVLTVLVGSLKLVGLIDEGRKAQLVVLISAWLTQGGLDVSNSKDVYATAIVAASAAALYHLAKWLFPKIAAWFSSIGKKVSPA